MAVAISSCVVELIHRAAVDAAPYEGCGLLFGTHERISAASVTANVAADPHRRFEIDPAALFAALRAERAGATAIVGHWHSHPGGDCRPSPTDAAMAVDLGRLWIIVANGQIGAWRAARGWALHDRFEPLELTID